MSTGSRAMAVALFALLTGCSGVPGHTHDPSEVSEVIPVTFYGGHVLSVQTAGIGSADGAVALTIEPAPGVIIGAGGTSGAVPGNGTATIAAGFVGLTGVARGGTATGLEYTVAVDGPTRQVVQVTQYLWPEDYTYVATGWIPVGTPVAIRVVGTKGRVIPLSIVPFADRGRIELGEIPLPLGAPHLANLVAPPLMHCERMIPDQVTYCDEPRW
jgi:hypothetical protein